MIKDLTYPIPWHDSWAIIDSSKLSDDFMTCPRMFFYRDVLGWRSTAPNNHLIFGEAWHEAQEHLLINGYKEIEDAMMLFMAKYREELGPETDDLFAPKTPAKAEAALKEYAREYGNDLLKWDVLYTEIAGSVMISPTDIMYFRMDSILRERDSGKYLSLDHKTGSRKGSSWTDKWALAMAIGLYTHVLYCLYPKDEVKGVQIRGTFFYKSKPVEFEDVPCWKSPNQMDTWLWNTNWWYNLLKHNFELLSECSDSDDVMMAFPMNCESCTKYFGCAYHDFCTAWPNPLQKCDQPPLGFKQEFWNPLEKESTHKMEELGK